MCFSPGEQEIKALKVKCNNDENGCGWIGELQSLDNHLTTCGYALLRCTNKCTNKTEEVYVLRRDMDNHLKNMCPNRQYQCPHCKDTGRHYEITTTHLDTCPKLKIRCPNAQCNVSVPRIIEQNVCLRRYAASMQKLGVRKRHFVKTYNSMRMTTRSTFSLQWKLSTSSRRR